MPADGNIAAHSPTGEFGTLVSDGSYKKYYQI
jgi:hypothetical protein